LVAIRDVLQQLAELDYQLYMGNKDHDVCDSILPCEHRGAGV
jgi:hypothetical protein